MERDLGNHEPGVQLPDTVTVVSNSVRDGSRTVVMTRTIAGAHSDNYKFDPNANQITYINALGGSELNWDPAGFLEGKSELEVNRYREAELTHGRVGMLASLGFLVQEKFHPLFSGDGGPAIDQIPQLPVWLWVVMTAGIGAAEAYRINIAFRELDGEKLKAETALRPGYVPGQIGFDPLGLAPEDPAEFREIRRRSSPTRASR